MVNQRRMGPLSASEGTDTPCAHHWRIERPAGETSKGVCQLCGASRDFLNYGYKPVMSRPRRVPTSRDNGPTPA